MGGKKHVSHLNNDAIHEEAGDDDVDTDDDDIVHTHCVAWTEKEKKNTFLLFFQLLNF